MAGSGQIRQLRRRIKSVKSTQKITRAMEMIAASRIVKAQRRMAAAVPYAEQITEVIKGLAVSNEVDDHPLLAPHESIDRVAVIVITSDRYPQEIPELEERLRTRFQWGLIADIQPPEIETRIAILQKKAETEALDIPDDVAMFIAQSVKSSVREIEGSLKRLGAFASMLGKPITLEFAKQELKDIMGTSSPLSIEDVQKTVCAHFNVKVSDLKGKRRHRSISRPRQIAMYLCRLYLNSTFPEIGAKFNKDHSTAISAVQSIEKLMKTEPSVREAIEAIRRQLGI